MAAPTPSADFCKSQHSYSGLASRTSSSAIQSSSRLRLRLIGLPPQTSTLDIYENLHRYGSIVRISLFETREGFKSTKAEIDFQPPPSQDFWRRPILFETRSHQSAEVHFQTVNNLPQVFTTESPLRKGVKYNDRTELRGKVLDFGVLVEAQTMMVMGRAGNMQQQPKLVLNLKRKEIEIHFPWQQISSNRSAVRTFRFNIALDAEVKVWELSDGSFTFHLVKPPWYSKQLAEAIANTHSPDARLWTIEDTWARQTDLWTYKQSIPEINSSPITLAKHLNDINIFRWTTFRFDPVNENANRSAVRTFVDALKDWNVKVQPGEGFQTFDAQPGLDERLWKLINGTHLDKDCSSSVDILRFHLPFAVRYQLEVCLSHGWISEYSISPNFLEQLSQLPEAEAKQALLYVAIDQKRLFDPTVIFSDIHYSKPVRAKRLPDNCIEICSATVTTTGILFNTPAVEITNRIIRNHKTHAHRFLRVRFEDDDYRGQTRLYPSTNNKMVMIFTRVKRALTYGIRLGNILYEFLAWGNSQLREHGAYFFASTDDLTADSIRAEMGSFKETVVAKKAARMGQCFSTTRPVRLQLKMVHEPDTIPDIIRNGYTFSDGVGKISPAAADLVATQLQIKGPTPCLFQFRLGGCKGVLAVSKDVPGVDVRIRKSQLKFQAIANELEINRYAQFWQASLNRQIILCLSSLGVPTEVFIRRQADTIAILNRAMSDDGAAINALRSNVDPNMMTLELSHMVEAGFRRSQEPFAVALLELWRAWSLKYLKEKAKIPVEEGAFVLGTVDETASLQGHTDACPSGDIDAIMADPAALQKLPEIFLQITDHKTGERKIIEGLCILARNPSLHRGDIRVVQARNVSALHHMCDVVVMPQLGDRDLPSMCSGGDLDGDDYIVIWAQDLLPRYCNAEPFHYEPPVPKTAIGEIKTSDLIDFFHDYMQNDALGKIATAHMAAADYFDDGLENRICLDLAQLHSMAVDYPKTGVPAKMERRLERPEKPHFMEPRNKPYKSYKVLGRLYDEISKLYGKLQKDTSVKHDLEFDSRILNSYDPDMNILNKVENVKRAYDISLRRILTQHSIQTEFELWSTFVLEHSKKSRDYKFHEEVGNLSRVLKEEFYEELCDLAGGRDFDHLAPVAVAAYTLTQKQFQAAKLQAQSDPRSEDEAPVSMPFISFPWLLQDTLIKIASQIEDRDMQNSDGKSTTNVVGGSVDGQPADELHDVADFQLTRNKLSPYLPDPLATVSITSVAPEAWKPDTMSREKIVLEQSVNNFDNPLIKESNLASDPGLDLVPPVDGALTNISHKSQDSTADKTSWDAVSHFPEDGSQFSFVEGQPQSASSNPGEPQSRLSLPQATPNSETSGRDPMLATNERSFSIAQPVTPVNIRLRRQATCFYWKMRGDCRYSEQECKYAHLDTGVVAPEKQQVTCYYWFNGNRCNLDEVSCKFAHYDTGYYAPQPLVNTSIKSQDRPKTKRVVAESSESDGDDEHWISVEDSRQPRLAAKTSCLRAESVTMHEQINGGNGQELYEHNHNHPGMDVTHRHSAGKSPTGKRTVTLLPRKTYTTSYVNDAITVHGLTREPSIPPKSPKRNSDATVPTSRLAVRSPTSAARVLPRTKPTPQLITLNDRPTFSGPFHTARHPAGLSHGRSGEKRSSWADELEGLRFNDTTAAIPPEHGTPEEPKEQLSSITKTHKHNALPHHYVSTVTDQDGTQRLPESANKLKCLTEDSEREGQANLLIDLQDDLISKPSRDLSHNNAMRLSQNSVSMNEAFMTIADERLSEIPSTTNNANTFGDPAICRDDEEEPEIEELFD